MPILLAAVSGGAIIAGFAVLMLLVLAYNFYSVKGSGIDTHSGGGQDDAPGADAPSEAGKGRGAEDSANEGEDAGGGVFAGHGTK